jgi:hypothetical protein
MSAAYRTRFSPLGGALGTGMSPDDLWGVAAKNPPPRFDPKAGPRRSAAACARRRAKRAAARLDMPLKAYLRKYRS